MLFLVAVPSRFDDCLLLSPLFLSVESFESVLFGVGLFPPDVLVDELVVKLSFVEVGLVGVVVVFVDEVLLVVVELVVVLGLPPDV